MNLLPEQREALIDALIENWPGHSDPNAIDTILLFGRVGFADYSDDELVTTAMEWDLTERLAELGIKEA